VEREEKRAGRAGTADREEVEVELPSMVVFPSLLAVPISSLDGWTLMTFRLAMRGPHKTD
jgi:hypothetical protein